MGDMFAITSEREKKNRRNYADATTAVCVCVCAPCAVCILISLSIIIILCCSFLFASRFPIKKHEPQAKRTGMWMNSDCIQRTASWFLFQENNGKWKNQELILFEYYHWSAFVCTLNIAHIAHIAHALPP